ncbi:MAG: PAS domain S-box protein, partial [Deltaproteobacteria bacterium]|nr:PAS domain S-box protein [Deltaproteobacteria bacterium]
IAYYRKHKKDASLLRDAKRSLKKLRKWGAGAPDNYLYKAQLVEAELLSIKGKQAPALKLYEAAIENAQKAGNNLDLGIACECMGRYLESIGLKSNALIYIRRSITVFHDWGALNKSNRLEKEYDIKIGKGDISPESTGSTPSSQTINVRLNMEALSGTIKSLTSDLKFDSLLATLLDAVMQNSGATRVVYIHVDQGNLQVRAEKLVNDDVMICDGKDTRPVSFGLPATLLKKCYSGSHEHVLENIENERRPLGDEHQEIQLKSILLIPLIRHQSVKGLVYLENDLMEDAFREDHVQFMSLLAGQAAIAIENSLIFEYLNEERDYSANIIQNSPILICGIDSNGITTFINPVIEEVTGYSKDELIGKNWWELLYPGKEYKQVGLLFKVFEEGDLVNNYEMTITCKNGDKRDILWNRLIKRDSSRNIIEVIGFGNDITERKRTEEELRESEEKFKILFENAPDAYYLNDLEGNFIDGNKAAEELLGYKRDELIGKSFFETGLLPPDQIPRAVKILEKNVKGQPAAVEELELKRKDGGRVSIEVSAIPIKLKGKKLVVGIARDITERKRLEGSLRQAQKMEAIGTLAGGIAHDFNNILSPLLGYAEMLKEDLPADHPFQANADAMLHAALRARDLVKQILIFSRKSESEIKPIKLQPILKEALKLLRSSIPKTIDIQKDIDSRCGVINADPTHIHQIVMNLATNAYHAMENTGGKLTVTLKQILIEQKYSEYSDLLPGTYAQLTVADTGIGMESTVLDKVFDPYFTTKEEGKGTGLGLSVVHGIVKECGGDIRIYSEPGKGTDIHVYMPVIESKAEKRVEQTGLIPGGTERILLVDDEEVIVSLEQQLLERLGYNVTIRTGSIEALEAFKANSGKFDLIITDMTMPNMTGIQLAQEIKKIKATIPIIICTGFSNQLTDEKCRTLGIQGYVMKPVVIRELAETIRKALDTFEKS